MSEFLCGGGASALAVVFTNPADTVKTRLQVQGELRAKGAGPRPYGGVVDAFYSIARTEGVVALQKGLFASAIYQVHSSFLAARLRAEVLTPPLP